MGFPPAVFALSFLFGSCSFDGTLPSLFSSSFYVGLCCLRDLGSLSVADALERFFAFLLRRNEVAFP